MTAPPILNLVIAGLGLALAAFSVAWTIQQRKLNHAQQTGRMFAEWWSTAVGKQLAAEAKLDRIHQQHVDAGKAAHAAERDMRLAVAERLKMLPVQPLRPRDEIAAEVRAARQARRAS
jgi:hypothetical protein